MLEIIKGKEIEESFKKEYRHYLTGYLTRPQDSLQHFENDIEIGMSDYKEFTADVPHVHPVATEQCYILKGRLKMRCFPENGEMEEYEFEEGDFFIIRPGLKHASKNMSGTRVLFIKNPGINDKTAFEVDEDTKQWLSHWE